MSEAAIDEEPRAVGAEDENEVAGTPAAAPASDAVATAAPTAADAGAIDAMLRIEVEVATYAMVRRIAAAVAERCRRAVGTAADRRILIVPPSAAAAMGRARFILAELDTLAEAMERLAPEPADEGVEGVAAAIAGGAAALAAELKPILSGIAEAALVTEAQAGRTVAVEEEALTAALGGQLVRLKLSPGVIGGDLPLVAGVPPALVRVRRAAARLRAVEVQPEVSAILARVDAALAPFAAPGGELGPAWQLMAALARDPPPLALVAAVLAAGGRYRMRRHLLTALGLADPLAWSGGAAVRFALLDPRTGGLLDSDIVYGAGRPGRLGPGDDADVGGDTT